jgi:hypothetical protein
MKGEMSLPNVCPKCQRERRAGEDACARCGLLVARWSGFQAELPTLEPVDRAWAELLGAWSEPEAHRRFVERAAQCDGLDVAAALYRHHLRSHPGDAFAEEGLKRTVTVAQSAYSERAAEARLASGPPGFSLGLRLAMLLILILGAALGYWLVRR